MIVSEVATIFDEFIDEDDESYLSAARREAYLARGYSQFRQLVTQLSPWHYVAIAPFVFNGVRTYDLAVAVPPNPSILGLTPTLAAMEKAIAFVEPAGAISGGRPTEHWKWVFSLRELGLEARSVMIRGTILHLSQETSGTYDLYYMPRSVVNWATGASHIDDLDTYHELIALYAADRYAVRDEQISQARMMLKKEMEMGLEGYLRERIGTQDDWVRRITVSYDW